MKDIKGKLLTDTDTDIRNITNDNRQILSKNINVVAQKPSTISTRITNPGYIAMN